MRCSQNPVLVLKHGEGLLNERILGSIAHELANYLTRALNAGEFHSPYGSPPALVVNQNRLSRSIED